MPPETLDFRERADLVEFMDQPCPRDVLRSYLRSLARTNRWTFAYRPLLAWLDFFAPALSALAGPIRILDIGSGYGDGLRRIERWARIRRIPVQLTGIDLNPDATAIADEATPAKSRIRWLTADAFSYSPPAPPHLIVSSLFTHHLANSEIVCFLQWMESHASLGWFVNDLARGSRSYHFFRVYSRLARFHPCVQNDGPISIARSFVIEDWRRLCSQAGLTANEAVIRPCWPGRLCVARRIPS
jgi:SAM-dependent methyltransferase